MICFSSVFGNRLDLHTGGEDLVFPHHENEIALSQVYHNCNQWSNYWLHTGALFCILCRVLCLDILLHRSHAVPSFVILG